MTFEQMMLAAMVAAIGELWRRHIMHHRAVTEELEDCKTKHEECLDDRWRIWGVVKKLRSMLGQDHDDDVLMIADSRIAAIERERNGNH